MAITLPLLSLSNGLDLPEAYLKAVLTELNALTRTAKVTFFVYKDAASRVAGKEPLSVPFPTTFYFTGEDYDKFFGGTSTKSWQGNCYDAAKVLDLFANATDC